VGVDCYLIFDVLKDLKLDIKFSQKCRNSWLLLQRGLEKESGGGVELTLRCFLHKIQIYKIVTSALKP